MANVGTSKRQRRLMPRKSRAFSHPSAGIGIAQSGSGVGETLLLEGHMTARDLCASGNHELLKSSVHGMATVVAGVMAAYNIAACCFRRDRHLRINSVVYTLAFAWEVKQTLHHLTACEGRDASSDVSRPAA